MSLHQCNDTLNTQYATVICIVHNYSCVPDFQNSTYNKYMSIYLCIHVLT